MTNAFQTMGVSKSAQTPGGLAMSRAAQSPMGMPVQHPQMAMYPISYYAVSPTAPARYVLDQTPTRSQGIPQGIPPMSPLTPMTGGMPIMGSLYTPPATPMFQGDYTSPRSLQTYGRFDGGRFDSRRQNAMRVNRSPHYNAAGHHNHVDVNRIRDGIDVRTTVS